MQPPVDDSPATTAVLRMLHPNDSGEAVELSSDDQVWMDKLAVAKEHIKEEKSRETEAKNHLMESLGDASYGEFPDGRSCSWKTQTKKSFVVKESTTRVFRVAKKLPKGVNIS